MGVSDFYYILCNDSDSEGNISDSLEREEVTEVNMRYFIYEIYAQTFVIKYEIRKQNRNEVVYALLHGDCRLKQCSKNWEADYFRIMCCVYIIFLNSRH